MSKPSGAAPVLSARTSFDADYAQLPTRYPSVHDLVEVLGGGLQGRERLTDAYAQGWLRWEDARLLEEAGSLLTCWLLARLVRLTLQGRA